MHGIIDDTVANTWQPLRMQHTKQALAVTLKILSKKYTFISLTTAVEILKKQRLPVNNALVITLDDGYLNNLTLGAPLFALFNISPTIFVSTEHSEYNQPFWFDRLDYSFLIAKQERNCNKVMPLFAEKLKHTLNLISQCEISSAVSAKR
jgi:hypothetical protein